MKINIYRRDVKQPKTRNSVERFLELTIKSIILFALPLFPSTGITCGWYYGLYKHSIFFGGEMEAIITCAWIPTFAILYALVTAKVLDTVWGEYKSMREAMKMGTRGVLKFVKLRDEKVSPLIYMVIYVLSWFILLAFMVVKYPCSLGGLCTVAATSYLFVLIMLIIKEIDNPCGGLWFIHRMPVEWLKIDARKFHSKVATLPETHLKDIKELERLIDNCQIK